MRRSSVIAKYLDELYDIPDSGKGSFLYRGQENSDWPLLSADARRLHETLGIPENKPIDKEVFFKYHERQLLEKVRRHGWHYEPGIVDLSDLELLALLQHQGAATCLLDFTVRFDVALWFACRGMGEKEANAGVDGKVFVVDTEGDGRPPDLEKVGLDLKEYGVERLLNPEQQSIIWHWEPRMRRTRILNQGSQFLIRPYPYHAVPEMNRFIIIKKEDKAALLEELSSRQALNSLSVFPDVQGFANANSSGMPLPETEVELYNNILARRNDSKGA